MLADKRIIVGVTGGIAAYKTAELVRRLSGEGAQVQVVMSAGAEAFVTPLSLQSLSGRAVRRHLLDPESEAAMGHIELARWADAILVAPATAHCMAKLAQGLADDLLTTLCLASEATLLLAPAMNQVMWRHPATVANRQTLAAHGATIIGPDTGEQACGEVGPGRMAETEVLLTAVAERLGPGPLTGMRVLVTAGPTQEAIDPVRFVGNRSSGKMGYALAAAARAAGAEVVLVSGPTGLSPPAGCRLVAVGSAAEMQTAVNAEAGQLDLLIAAAAVADYRPRQPAAGKLKKQGTTLTLTLERTPDIVAEAAQWRERPFLVGFAAETDEVARNAQDKLARKGLDMVVANQVGPGLGFGTDDNIVTVFWPGGEQRFPATAKPQLARDLITLIAKHYHAKGQDQDTG